MVCEHPLGLGLASSTFGTRMNEARIFRASRPRYVVALVARCTVVIARPLLLGYTFHASGASTGARAASICRTGLPR